MKFYLSSAQHWESYNDLKNNKLMQKYLQEIMKATGYDLVIEQEFDEDNKYPIICIYDDYIE